MNCARVDRASPLEGAMEEEARCSRIGDRSYGIEASFIFSNLAIYDRDSEK